MHIQGFSVLKQDFESFCFKQNIRETVAFADWIMYGLISKFRQNLPSNSWREFSISFLPEIEKKNHHLLRENSSKTTGNGCTTVWDCHWAVSQLIDEKPTEDSKYMGTVSDLGSPWDAKFWENTLGKYHCSYAHTDASAADCCQRQETAAVWTSASSKIKKVILVILSCFILVRHLESLPITLSSYFSDQNFSTIPAYRLKQGK